MKDFYSRNRCLYRSVRLLSHLITLFNFLSRFDDVNGRDLSPDILIVCTVSWFRFYRLFARFRLKRMRERVSGDTVASFYFI